MAQFSGAELPVQLESCSAAIKLLENSLDEANL